MTPSAPLSQSSPSAVSTSPDTPRSGSPAVSNGTKSLRPRPSQPRARRMRPRRSGLRSTRGCRTRRWRARVPRRVPAPAANTRTESPTTSTRSPLWYPSHVRPLLSAVITLGRLRSSPCGASNCSQPRPGRRRKTPTLNAIATHSPPSRSRATAWISRPLGRSRAAPVAGARERTRHPSAPRVRDRRSRGRRGDRGRCTSASRGHRAAGRYGHRR